MGRRLNRGDVRCCSFDPPDKRRPVVILTRSSTLPAINSVTVAPVTRTVRNVPSQIVVGPEDGLPYPSAVNLQNVQTVSKSRMGALICTLSPHHMAAIADAQAFALGFDEDVAFLR